MRIVKLALISVLIFFLLATAISLLLPSQVIISRAIDITASKSEIFKTLGSVSEWKHWVENRDSLPVSHHKKTFVMGTTKATISTADTNQIKTNWQVGEGAILPAEFNLISQPGSTYTTMQWQFIQRVKWYPWEKFASIVSDKILGGFMEASLDNLKLYVEASNTKQPEQ